MSYELIVATVSSEELGRSGLWTWTVDEATGAKHVRVHELYSKEEWWTLSRDIDEIMRRHPDAHYLLGVHPKDVWELPIEPRGLGDRARGQRARHTRAVAASLEGFLRERLCRLEGMVRTGWWILQKVDVKITHLRGTPDLKRRARRPPARSTTTDSTA